MAKKEANSVKSHPLKKYLFLIVLALLILMSYFILKSYLIALISAFILAYLFKPLYDFFARKIPPFLAASICIVLIASLAIITFTVVLANVINQAYTVLDLQSFKTFLSQLSSYPLTEKIGIDLNDLLQKSISLLISIISSAITYLPSLVISLLITVIGCYFILIQWNSIVKSIKSYIPLKNKDALIKEIEQTTHGIIHGHLLIALLQFVFSALAFYFLGIKTYALIATIIFFFSFIPFVGPATVWLPIAAYQLIMQNYYIALGVLITGIILSGFFDFILKAHILGKKAKINPFVMLLGILGGVPLFGIFGFIIGPLVLVYTLKFLKQALK